MVTGRAKSIAAQLGGLSPWLLTCYSHKDFTNIGPNGPEVLPPQWSRLHTLGHRVSIVYILGAEGLQYRTFNYRNHHFRRLLQLRYGALYEERTRIMAMAVSRRHRSPFECTSGTLKGPKYMTSTYFGVQRYTSRAYFGLSETPVDDQNLA